MRQVVCCVGLGAVLLAGCNHSPVRRNDVPPQYSMNVKTPGAAELVQYLNNNSDALKDGVQCKVDMDAKQGDDGGSLGGYMACQQPRSFRLRAKMLSNPAVDLGSNNDEFWYWFNQKGERKDGPYVYHCSHEALAKGGVRMPFPFQPEMLLAAMGMTRYDPDPKKYRVQVNPNTLELISDAVTPQGQQVQRVVVFNRMIQRPPQPQIMAHVLRDARGKTICQATIQEVQGSGSAIIPRKVELAWPSERARLTMVLDNPTFRVTAPEAARLFQRGDLSSFTSVDLATGTADNPGGTQRAGFQTQSRIRSYRP